MRPSLVCFAKEVFALNCLWLINYEILIKSKEHVTSDSTINCSYKSICHLNFSFINHEFNGKEFHYRVPVLFFSPAAAKVRRFKIIAGKRSDPPQIFFQILHNKRFLRISVNLKPTKMQSPKEKTLIDEADELAGGLLTGYAQI